MKKQLLLLVALLALPALARAATIADLKDGGWSITGKTYTAQVNAQGGLVSLKLGDIEILGADKNKNIGAPFPAEKPPANVNVRGPMIAARDGDIRVEYTFDDTGFNVEAEGNVWNCQLDQKKISAFVQQDGSVRTGATGGLGDVRRVLFGNTGLSVDTDMHCVAGRLFPSAIARGGKKEALFKTRFELGISADATVLVEIKDFAAKDKDPKVAPSYKENEKPGYTIELRNLGAKDRDVAFEYTIGTHFVGGTASAPVSVPAIKVPAGQTASTTFEVTPPAPGVHWLNLELKVDGKTVKRERRAFVYAPDKYLPKLTRPDDFREFWQKHLTAVRAEDMKPVVKEIPEKSTDVAGFYNVTLTIRGETYELALAAPKKPGKYLAVFGGKLGEKATDADRVITNLPHAKWPQQATYTRWVSESDNNLFDCYMVAVRITDYLRSRPDVDRIYLSGGSRQGAIQLVNAALDPTKIVATEPHVPTCVGISWPDYAYKGWGSVPKPPTMARYVDPVNFAPDMTVPFIVDLGAYDGLSPAPGGLAFYNYATKAPFKRFSIELGGHGYFTSGFKKTAKAELEKLLDANTTVNQDDRVLKEH